MANLLFGLLGFLVVLAVRVSSQNVVNSCSTTLKDSSKLKVHNNYCYLFELSKQRSRNEARAYCKSLGGSLLMPKTADAQNYIVQELHSYQFKGRVWMGLNDEAKEFDYRWDDGSILKKDDYSAWISGHGLDRTKSSLLHHLNDCIYMDMKNSDGLWGESMCGFFALEKRIICQFQAYPTLTTTPPMPTTTKAGTPQNCPDFQCNEQCDNGYVKDPTTGCDICLCKA